MLEGLKDILFPEDIKCIVCDDELPAQSSSGLCRKCKLNPNAVYCSKCGRFINDTAKPSNDYVCEQCDTQYKPVYENARAPFVYEGNARKLVKDFKYGGKKHLGKNLAAFMLPCLSDAAKEVDFITFVPIHKSRLKSRGFNQAEVLANEISTLTGIPAIPVLEKLKKSKNTAGMTRAKRFDALNGSIGVLEGITFQNQSVLLVDDVLTTGATANECAQQLKFAGMGKIFIMTFATSKVRV